MDIDVFFLHQKLEDIADERMGSKKTRWVVVSTRSVPFARHPTSPLWAARRQGGIERRMRKEGDVEQTWK
jgi:hypothetical protein